MQASRLIRSSARIGEDTPLGTGLVWELKLQILISLRVFRTDRIPIFLAIKVSVGVVRRELTI